MPSTSLASVDQLGAYLKTTFAADDPAATLYLSIASGIVRDFLQQQVTAIAADVVLLDPLDGAYVMLPELPVTAVTLVETFDGAAWSAVDFGTITVSKRLGMIAARPGLDVQWPSDPESWRVTYDHGYAEVPDSLVGVTLGVAAREYASDPGVDLERIGGYQVKYAAVEANGFNGLELKALARYQVARVA